MVLLDPQAFVERILEVARVHDAIPIVHGLTEARRVLAISFPSSGNFTVAR